MSEQPASRGTDLDQLREYLHLLARLQLPPRMQAKVDVSGIVQQTLLEAHQAHQKNGQAAAKPAWLRKILTNNLHDELRRWRTEARDVERERSLQALEESSSRLENWLAAEQSSPSQHVVREEKLMSLAAALAKLPEEQRQAVEMHHLQGVPLASVAAHLKRSKGAVAALLFRALKKLRELLAAF